MIIVTGAAGFIGSCLATELNKQGYNELVLVDEFSHPAKNANLQHCPNGELVHRNEFFDWLEGKQDRVQFIFHIGARTDTAEFDEDLLNALNFDYSKKIFEWCTLHQVPLIYASSAATYGLGDSGFGDNPDQLDRLHPLNPYGMSKHRFDLWVMEQAAQPYFWAGFKFFNVFGPNEYHKGRMASVVWHAYHQIKEKGQVSLFRSHHPQYTDGGQKRDFIYVKDVLRVLLHFMHHRKNSGLYNLGTGTARTFLELARAVFGALNKEPAIAFIDTPVDIRDKYQYFTQAETMRLVGAGYQGGFTALETAITDYVTQYLEPGQYF
jgi:ADP-L-glycero-D-manno-heptose 6-epimerase